MNRSRQLGIFRRGLSKTRQSFFGRISQLLGNTEIDDDTWDDMETLLIQADVGFNTTVKVVDALRDRVRAEGITKTDQLNAALKSELAALLSFPPALDISGRELSIILVVGVNGSGKTTSIAKLAHRLKNLSRRKVMIAAGDTFRAAAIEQLQTWGQRIDVPVVANRPGSDPGAVVYDATNAAKARGYDILIIDTAGRLQNNFNLMRELTKISEVSGKVVPDAPHEVLLVLDGTTGQNAIEQAKSFQEASGVSGVIVTKLDSTAKGGMVFSIFHDLHLPVHYLGLGETIDDLVLFTPEFFVDSLFDDAPEN
ncbi:MAG: signal recognition particle-docking protein FtsY [Chloroflexi bacterium]|nr:signal recognition particle-docking protein FtsY [Chloroflexota bacterium]MCY3717678.1 signal recognition particle-docking protein FtsY [Chloroflexota bacterium]MXV92885.1 signal recognition particle-docking protein FtsY [Chloroflexota bacterium]MXX50058.1 signal recognition particle-docking protein FtsY [Chloroflexota bacterium]MXX83185.1 signal recognition particle-docking protein FtsY [Chloroflexota bacterium]